MNTSIKIVSYVGVLAAAFGGAYSIGSVTGSPIERPADHDESAASHDESAAGNDEPAAGHDLHDSATEPAASHADAPPGLQVSASGYTLSPISAPQTTGEQGTLSFSILGPDGTAVTEFTESHEKDLHLIVVRTDTSEYRHVHPTLDADGTWTIDWAWATGGTYKVFADFEPTAHGDGLTLARTVDVAGEVVPAAPLEETRESVVDGYTVRLAGEPAAGESSELTVNVERDGRPVTDLEPYLGAYGHLVALRDGDLAYLHVHPEGEPGDGVTAPGPDVGFVVETPTASVYRLYFDFQVDGKVRTATFTVDAAAPGAAAPGATAPDEAAPDDEHGHTDTDTDADIGH